MTWILLQPKSKAPSGRRHQTTDDPAVVKAHLARGGNVGRTGAAQATLDFDDVAAMRQMLEALGPLPLHVETGSGKFHSYVAPDRTLPAALWFKGRSIGQIKRLPSEYVVCPPSVHPNGQPYRWLIPPPHDLAVLPSSWREYVETQEHKVNPSEGGGERFMLLEKLADGKAGPIVSGERHRTLWKLVRSMKARGYSKEEVLELLLLVNEELVQPPLLDAEAYIRRGFDQRDRAL